MTPQAWSANAGHACGSFRGLRARSIGESNAMRMKVAGLALLGLMAGTAWMAGAALAADKPAQPEAAPLVTPPGIILNGTRTGTVYANAKGMTLYTFDMDKEPGKSV